MRGLLAATIAAAALALCSAPAGAETPDDAFIAELDANGIQYVTRAAAIAAGRSVCDSFDQGYTIDAVTLGVARSGSQLKSIEEADDFVFAAVSAYCPHLIGT